MSIKDNERERQVAEFRAQTIEETARAFEGMPTSLGEPSPADAMFSDRYVDVEHMPREVRSGAYDEPTDAEISAEEISVGSSMLLVAFGLAVMAVGIIAALGVLMPR
jgi:hypothetical protein